MSEEAEGPVTCNVIVVARRHVLRAIRWKDEEEYGLRANGRVGRGYVLFLVEKCRCGSEIVSALSCLLLS